MEDSFSLVSFGVDGIQDLTVWGVIIFLLYRLGIVQVDWYPSMAAVCRDIVIIFIWNEIHFFSIHCLLHRPWLYRNVHFVHHKSVITTPFSTYSFHLGESIALGSVMVWIVPFWTVSFTALAIFPLINLAINTIAHSDYSLLKAVPSELLAPSERHSTHHRQVGKEFGFLLPYFDRWLWRR